MSYLCAQRLVAELGIRESDPEHHIKNIQI